MLEYIKQQIALKQQQVVNEHDEVITSSDDQMDDTIMECMQMFDDMSDLTMEGANAYRERPILDIPLDEDIELDSLEMSITSNRLMDIPGDITAMEHVYEDQKTFNDFYQEAYNSITKLPREDENHFVERVTKHATDRYDAYMEYVIQEGLFGNDTLNINDERVPRFVTVNFGKYGTGDYIAKLPVGFEVTSNDKININQLHAITIAQNLQVFKYINEPLRIIMQQQGFTVKGSVWDTATPKALIVPKYNGEYRVVVQFDIEDGEDIYITWGIPESKVRKSKLGEIDTDEFKNVKMERPAEKFDANKIKSMNLSFKGKNPIVQESYHETIIPSRWGNDEPTYYQEAIDFGGGDNTDTPPAEGSTNTNDAGADANINAGADADLGGDIGGDANTDAPKVDADAKPAAVNNVSDAIAAKVSNDANKDPVDLGMDAAPTFDSNPDVKLDLDSGSTDAASSEDVNNLEPDMSADTSNDMGSTDNFDTPDVTGDLDKSSTDMNAVDDELNSDDSGDAEFGGGSMDNIDDMSIDDLLAKGEDKLKGMSIAQLKDFLSDGLGNDTNEEATIEYAVDNSIKNRINVATKRCLATLNNDKPSIKQLIEEFGVESKKLNNCLVDASKSGSLNDAEKSAINAYNQVLTNLRMKFAHNPTATENKKPVKEALINFAKHAKKIGEMCDASKPVTMEQAMDCTTDEFGVIVETVTGKMVKEALIWWFIGGIVKRDEPYGDFRFNKNFILALLSPFTLGITGIVATVRNIVDIYHLLNDGVDEMVAVELTKDITNAYSLLTVSDDSTSINAKVGKFKSALKRIIDDTKYAHKCEKEEVREAIRDLASKTNAVLNAVQSKSNTRTVDPNILRDFVDAMESTLEALYDKNALKKNANEIKKAINSKK